MLLIGVAAPIIRLSIACTYTIEHVSTMKETERYCCFEFCTFKNMWPYFIDQYIN